MVIYNVSYEIRVHSDEHEVVGYGFLEKYTFYTIGCLSTRGYISWSILPHLHRRQTRDPDQTSSPLTLFYNRDMYALRRTSETPSFLDSHRKAQDICERQSVSAAQSSRVLTDTASK